MSFENFPTPQWVAVIGTGETLQMASFQPIISQEVYHIVLRILKRGSAGGSEVLMLGVYPTSDYIAPIGTASVTLSDITTDPYWFGNVRFDFNNDIYLLGFETYWLGLSVSNYTRNGDTYYIAAALDWPDALNSQADSTNVGCAFQLIGDF